MTPRFPGRVTAMLLATTLLAAGCQETDPTARVTGAVSYQGQPLTSGAIAFYPAEGRPVQSRINADGAYEAALPPGSYRVTVTVGLDLPAGWKEGDPLPKPAVHLPPALSSRARTPLTATVAPDQSEPIDFAL